MSTMTPVNLSASHVAQLASERTGTELEPPDAPGASDLANWEQENYQLSVSGALTLGFPVATVSAGVKSEVLIFGTSRWKDIESDGYTYRYGVSLRVVVQIRDFKVDGSLTIPVVAAKVQLEGARATAGLLVRGYKGDLRLPHWQSFDVSSYTEYQETVSTIQGTVTTDEANMDPQLLATTAAGAVLPAPAQGVGTVWALDAISHGETLGEALRKLAEYTEDESVRSTVRAIYKERLGGEGDSKPSDDAQEAARTDLHGVHIRHGLFS